MLVNMCEKGALVVDESVNKWIILEGIWQGLLQC